LPIDIYAAEGDGGTGSDGDFTMFILGDGKRAGDGCTIGDGVAAAVG
jgi:hypothetical protein